MQHSLSAYNIISASVNAHFVKSGKIQDSRKCAGKNRLTNRAKSNKINVWRPALHGNPVREAAPQAESAAAESSSSGNTPVC